MRAIHLVAIASKRGHLAVTLIRQRDVGRRRHQPGLWSDHDSGHASLHRGHGQRSAGVVRERLRLHCRAVGLGNRRAVQPHPRRRRGVQHLRRHDGRASPAAWPEVHPGPAVDLDCAQAECVRKVSLARRYASIPTLRARNRGLDLVRVATFCPARINGSSHVIVGLSGLDRTVGVGSARIEY